MPLLSEQAITALRLLAAERTHRVPRDIGAEHGACCELERLGLAETMWLGLYQPKRPAWSGARRQPVRKLFRVTRAGLRRLERIEAGRRREAG